MDVNPVFAIYDLRFTRRTGNQRSKDFARSAFDVPLWMLDVRCWVLDVPTPSATLPSVKLSVKSDYATRAVLGLARHFPNETALRVEQLAAAQDVPANYLVQILLELKAKGIAKSVRGKEGGYLLARPPAEISLGDVLRAVHGEVFDAPALSDKNCAPELRAAWRRLKTAADAAADAITFQQLLDDGSEKEKMYYI